MRKVWILALLLAVAACGKRNVAEDSPVDELDEPDRVLFERALRDLNRNRLTVSRLTLQTLINTYPDSEYLPQAKYALAESFYKEGTTSALNQAEAEFKDYITFFPTSDMADDAQLMVAMTHVRLMEKPDRDPTQALYAEAELKRMIEAYPDSSLLDEAKDKLRGVQEVLAEGVFKIGNHYMLRRAYGAAGSRYREILEKYPDYSGMPETLYSLAESLRLSDNAPEGAIYFSRVVTDHPLSEAAEEAKKRLVSLNMAVPEANPVALARAQSAPKPKGKGIMGTMFSVFNRRPDISTDTGAGSVRDDSGSTEDSQNSDSKEGSFGVDGRVVPTKPPAKKPY